MMSFKDFVHKYKLKNKATSNIIIYQLLCFIDFNNVGVYLRDGPFDCDKGIVNLHPTKEHRTLCLLYKNQKFFDSCGYSLPKKLSKFNIKRNGFC